MHEIDQFVITHYNMAMSILVIVGAFLKLIWDGRSNSDKLDKLLIKNDSMSVAQHNMQLDLSIQGTQMAGMAKDVGEIKTDMRSHEKEISSLKAELAGIKR
jgi:hypothetical protein